MSLAETDICDADPTGDLLAVLVGTCVNRTSLN